MQRLVPMPAGWVGVPLLFAALLSLPALGGGAPVGGPVATGVHPPSRSAASSDDWPVYLHDAARSSDNFAESAITLANAHTIREDWNFSSGDFIAAEPAVVNGTVYIGSWNGFEYALNATSGAVRWATNLSQGRDPNCGKMERGVTSSASVVNGVVYVGGGGGWWFALSATNGSVLWRIFLGNSSTYYNWASPLIVKGYAYIGIASACDKPLVRGALLMVSLTTHAVVHTFYTVSNGEQGGSIWSSPMYSAATNTVYFDTGNARSPTSHMAEAIVGVNATTLKRVGFWHVPAGQVGVDSDFGATVVLFPGPTPSQPLVGAANKNGLFYALNATNLSAGPLWIYRVANGGACPECGQGSISSAASDGNAIFVAGGRVTINGTNYSGSVAKLVPATGKVLWRQTLSAAVIPAVTYVNGMILVGAGDRLEVLDASTGALLYRFTTSLSIYGAAAVAEGCIYFGSSNGSVYALAPGGEGCGPEDDAANR